MRLVHCEVVLLMLTTALCFRTGGSDIRRTSHERRAKGTEVIPAPIVVPPSQYFDGIDGSWSTFNIRVGTPEQSVRVIASTNSPQTLVVRPQGCSVGAIPDGVPNNCPSTRGGTFDSDRSRSWLDQGWFGLNGGQVGYEANLGYNFNLDYGLDTLGLGFKDGDAPTLKNQTVSAYNLPNPLYVGQFGLGTQPVIYSTFGNYSVPSFFVTLRNQSLIPSLSWSYTAGASYRLSAGQYAQLIFGGYDTSRFQSNDVQFVLSKDVTRDIVVGVQSILYTGTTSSSLLSEPIYAFIESTDPNIWLPLSACLQFEQVFGLAYDTASQKYLMNTTQYTALSTANPSVTFRLASSTTGGATVDIALPFSAFGLKAAYPFVPNPTYYFPLRRAANETQYTLGRAFLQEAYITVDYDRGNFSVSQCTWQQSATSKIQTILAPDTNGTSGANGTNHNQDTGSKKSSSTPAIAASVAAVVVVAMIGAIGFWYWRRRKQQKKPVLEESSKGSAGTQLPLTDYKHQNPQIIEPETDETGSMFGQYKKDIPPPGSLHSYYKPGNESAISRGELPDSASEIHEVATEERPSEIGDSESRYRYELETPMPVEMEGNNEWERHELPSPIVGRGPVDGHIGHSNNVGSEASAMGLLGSSAAWHSISSRVSWRSAAVSSESSPQTPKEERPG